MKSRIIAMWMILFFISAAVAQNVNLTLQQSIETALANNILAKQSELQMQTTEINYRQAKNNRLPTLESQFNYGFNNGRSIDPFTNGYINQQLSSSNINTQLIVPVFNGFQLKNSIKQNELAFSTATMEWQQRKDELTLQVILAYTQILSNEDALTLARQQADISRQQVERLEIMGKEGATPPSNVSDLKGQYAGDQLAIIGAENNLASSELALTQLMNIPYNDSIKVDRAGFNETIKMYDVLPGQVYATALEKLASIKASELKIKSSAAAVKVAASQYYPSVSLYGVMNTNYSSAASINSLTGTSDVPNGDYVTVNGTKFPVITQQNKFNSNKISYPSQLNNNLSTAFGVSVTIPMFNAFKTRSAVKLAKNIEKNDRLLAENIKVQLRQAVDQAYINITTTYKRYNTLLSQADAYAESFRIASIRFENGVINASEYLIAKNNLERTNATLISTKYEYLLRVKVLDFYMGR